MLIGTEGRGGEAVVEVGGERLAVVDALSAVGEPARPGPVAGARLEVVTVARRVRRPAVERPAETGLERLRGWRYRGWGEVVGLTPPRVSLGVFEVALSEASGDAPLELGDLVPVEIDRIILSGTPPTGAD